MPETPNLFEVDINGQKYSQDEAKGLEKIVVETHVDMIGVAQITIGIGDEWTYEIGQTVKIKLAGDPDEVFHGYITGTRVQFNNGEYKQTIIAMDPLIKLAASRVTKVWEEMSDSDAASKAIGASAGTVDSTTGTRDYIFQRNESNLNFVKRLAARNGYLVLATHEGKVDFKKVQTGTAVEVKFDEGSVVSADFTATDVGVPPSVKVIGWDYVTKKMVSGEGSAVTGLGGAAAEAKTWEEPYVISDVFVNSDGAAKAMAEGEFQRMGRSFVRGRATVLCDAALRAGGTVKFSGQRENTNPEGLIISVRHTMVLKGGFTTEIHFVGDGELA